jgi:hypothetical protein
MNELPNLIKKMKALLTNKKKMTGDLPGRIWDFTQ